jgi:hypothetical protein
MMDFVILLLYRKKDFDLQYKLMEKIAGDW